MLQLRCEDLAVGYEGKAVLAGLTFQVEAGDYLAILGENGSGKTTLMKTLLGLQPALAGQVTFGQDFSARQIGYLPQQTQVQRDFPASVQEIVLSGLQGRSRRPFYRREDRVMAEAAMAKTQILPLARRCYRELSGGQQQRVLLARALCATQTLLLLDEPVTGLDPRASQDMYATIQELNREGITIIMISHDLEAALRYSDHILDVDAPVFFGSREDYLNQRRDRRPAPTNPLAGAAEPEPASTAEEVPHA